MQHDPPGSEPLLDLPLSHDGSDALSTSDVAQENGAGESFGSLFARLVDDAKAFVRAELVLYRANLSSRLGEAKIAAIMLIGAFFLAQSAIVALLVGLIIGLSPHLGPIGATAVVALGGIAVAAALGWSAIGKIGHLTSVSDNKPGNQTG